ncbi:glycerate dehydrogenase [Sesbania bispinosa]|nr:glycerate dehydrogenase [Sesbania bispinosa]
MAVRRMVTCSGKDCVKLVVGCCTSMSMGTGTRWRCGSQREDNVTGGEKRKLMTAHMAWMRKKMVVQQLNGYDDGFHSGEGSFCDGGRRS